MNDGRQSAKAMALYKKSEYIREKNNGKNVFLLTATPLTNSPLEYYNMTQFIAPNELQKMNIHTIDGFIKEFADIKEGWKYDWGHSQVKKGKILEGFKNLSTLQNIFFKYTDLQNNPDAIGLDKPLSENYPNIIQADKTQMNQLKAISEELDKYIAMDDIERAANFPGQNFLTFYSQMRTASLDLELYNPEKYKDWKNPKLEKLAQNAAENYKQTKGGQVIFCDRVFDSDAKFNMHEKIKQSLIAQGFKDSDIVIVNGFTKSGGNKSDSAVEKEVSKAISDYNAGKYKVIIGSTACIGEGVNLQKNSAALHHFDIPFRPSDFIQRNGRIDRQGNTQSKVELHTYMQTGTIDNYSVNLVQRKAGWIDQLLRTKSDVFTNPDNENAISPEELLLSLTEEWGDKDKAAERRAEIEKRKNEEITKAQTLQMKGYVQKLSLARGALSACNAGTKKYNTIETQIKNLENSLKDNPLFRHKSLLETKEPFLYNPDTDIPYRKGDALITKNGTFLIENLNFKKRELICKELLTPEERKYKEKYSYGGSYNDTRSLSVSSIKLPSEKNDYHDTVLYARFKQPDAAIINTLTSLKSEAFYNLPDDIKEKYYSVHVKLSNENYNSNFRPVIFSAGENGKIEIAHYTNDKILNPFSKNDIHAINEGLARHGVHGSICDKHFRETYIENIRETLPRFHNAVTAALQKHDAITLKQQQTEQQPPARQLKAAADKPMIPATPAAAVPARRKGRSL
jgi:hypothetical protein